MDIDPSPADVNKKVGGKGKEGEKEKVKGKGKEREGKEEGDDKGLETKAEAEFVDDGFVTPCLGLNAVTSSPYHLVPPSSPTPWFLS